MRQERAKPGSPRASKLVPCPKTRIVTPRAFLRRARTPCGAPTVLIAEIAFACQPPSPPRSWVIPLSLADVGDEGSELHTGDVAKKLFGICGMKVSLRPAPPAPASMASARLSWRTPPQPPAAVRLADSGLACCGRVEAARCCQFARAPRFPSSFELQIDFGSDAGLALDVSKKILCLYNKYDVTSGGDSAPKAEILEPGLITMIMQTIMPCGSQLVYRIRDTDSDEDLWHIRTPEACCHIACCPVRLLPCPRPGRFACRAALAIRA